MNNIDQLAEVTQAACHRIGLDGVITVIAGSDGKVSVHMNSAAFTEASKGKEIKQVSHDYGAYYNTELSYLTPSGCKVFCITQIEVAA